VVGENVTGIFTMEEREVFARVDSRRCVRFDDYDEYEAVYTRQAKMLVSGIIEDLEKEGYEVQTFNIPAAGVGAPHRRERVWFVAYRNDSRTYDNLRINGQGEKKNKRWKEQPFPKYWKDGFNGDVTNSDKYGLSRQTASTDDNRQHEAGKEKGRNLEDKISELMSKKLLPTPMASDNPGKNTGERNQDSIPKRIRDSGGKTSQLNPLFGAEMMGFPTDWTVLPFLAGETNQSKDLVTQ
jgi:site-specific DNA-cytosine methylase